MKDEPNPFEKIDKRFNILEGLVHKVLNALSIPNPHERLTRQMVARQYHVSLGTVHNAMKAGALKYDKIGAKTIFKRVDVEAWATLRK